MSRNVSSQCKSGFTLCNKLPPAQVPQRDIIDAEMAFFGTGCIINEQVILQDQEGVLAWVSERLAVAMRQAEDLILRDYIISAASEINAGGGSITITPQITGCQISAFSDDIGY